MAINESISVTPETTGRDEVKGHAPVAERSLTSAGIVRQINDTRAV